MTETSFPNFAFVIYAIIIRLKMTVVFEPEMKLMPYYVCIPLPCLVGTPRPSLLHRHQ